MLGGLQYSISPWIVVFVDWFVVLYLDSWQCPYTLPSLLLLVCCDPTLLLGTLRTYEMNIGDSLENKYLQIDLYYFLRIKHNEYNIAINRILGKVQTAFTPSLLSLFAFQYYSIDHIECKLII